MFCPKCGNEIKGQVKFCPKCGRSLTPNAQTTPPQNEPAPVAPAQSAPTAQAPVTPPPYPTNNAPQYPVNSTPQAPVAYNNQKPAPTNTPKPKKQKVKKEKSPVDSKKLLITCVLTLILFCLYALTSYIALALPSMEDTIIVSTISDSDNEIGITLGEMLSVMIHGNRIFYPTAISSALGTITYIFLYSVPVFAGLAFVGSVINKRATSLNIAFSVISLISAAVSALVVPVTVMLIPEFKQLLSINAGVVFNDIGKLSCTKLMIFAGLTVLLVIASIVFSAIVKVRRNKK
ncbi:MAG: zinc-ribbon domain-containing protein [Ruminococcus sp.]|nr:zinc-ribbon domain-containing protein [Ruminococcus sp.]